MLQREDELLGELGTLLATVLNHVVGQVHKDQPLRRFRCKRVTIDRLARPTCIRKPVRVPTFLQLPVPGLHDRFVMLAVMDQPK